MVLDEWDFDCIENPNCIKACGDLAGFSRLSHTDGSGDQSKVQTLVCGRETETGRLDSKLPESN